MPLLTRSLFRPMPIRRISRSLNAPHAPRDFIDSMKFASAGPVSTAHSFRGHQLSRLSNCALRFRPDSGRRYALAPDCIRPETGHINVAICAQLAEFIGLPDTPWLSQFVTGFPIAGLVSQGKNSPIGPTIHWRQLAIRSFFALRRAVPWPVRVCRHLSMPPTFGLRL